MVTRGHFITIKISPRGQPWGGKSKGTGAATPSSPSGAARGHSSESWDPKETLLAIVFKHFQHTPLPVFIREL